MCVYLYIHITNMQSTHILCKQKLLFWMRLITINHLTAQIRNSFIAKCVCKQKEFVKVLGASSTESTNSADNI